MNRMIASARPNTANVDSINELVTHFVTSSDEMLSVKKSRKNNILNDVNKLNETSYLQLLLSAAEYYEDNAAFDEAIFIYKSIIKSNIKKESLESMIAVATAIRNQMLIFDQLGDSYSIDYLFDMLIKNFEMHTSPEVDKIIHSTQLLFDK